MRTAAYARYSSDAQREASIDDQLRNCRAFASRQGWGEPAIFSDAAVSGARNDRPGYSALLAAAQARAFDVILVDDLSRLSRDSIESAKAVKRLSFAGVRLVGVSDGIDTARKDAKVGAGLRGLMSEIYLDDLADKTHRGLAGRALAGKSAGGLPFGYRVTATGERAIDDAQAAVVRRIFGEYLAGQSPRAIAIALNRDGVPSPRRKEWAPGAILGDVKRGIGILANPLYAGEQTWNRSKWVKHPDTGRRVRRERPREEWVTTHQPELAIVDVATWRAVQARLGGRVHTPGRPMRHLLSGLLRCGGCGGPIIVVDAQRYGCARQKDRGICPAPVSVRIRDAEPAMLAGVRDQLLSDEAFAAFRAAVADHLRAQQPNAEGAKKRLQEAERVRENVLAAIRDGFRSASVRLELERAEAAVATAQAEVRASAAAPTALLPRLREVWDDLRADLEAATRRKPAAREALRTLIGEATLRKNENGALVAEIAPSSSKLMMVAGARSGVWLYEPIQIPLGSASRAL